MAKVIGRETSTEDTSSEQYTKERSGYSTNDNHYNHNNRYTNKKHRKMMIYRRNGEDDDDLMDSEQAEMTETIGDEDEDDNDDRVAADGNDDADESGDGVKTVKYDLQVQAIFKRTPPDYATTSTVLRRGLMTWIIPVQSLQCRCPKIKLNK